MDSETKLCPYCGEEIRKAAKKCRYCKEWLVDHEETKASAAPHDAKALKPQFVIPKPHIQMSKVNPAKLAKIGKWAGAAVLAAAVVIGAFMLVPKLFGGSYQLEYDYIPFTSSDEYQWDMINDQGNTLPGKRNGASTAAMNGRYLIQGESGFWEIYTADKVSQKIGGQYQSIGLFFDDVTPAVEKGQPIKFIDRDANVKFIFDKVDGKLVEHCSPIINGTSVFSADRYYGVVSETGKVLIEPKYISIIKDVNNYFLCVDKKFENEKDGDKIVYQILDKNGKELFSYKKSKYQDLFIRNFGDTKQFVFDKKLLMLADRDGKRLWGLLDFNGEWIIKPSSKTVRIGDCYDGKIIFYNGERYGVMDMDGEVLLRAKYKELHFVTGDLFAAKGEDEKSLHLINNKGEQLGDNNFHEIFILNRNSNYFFAKVKDGEWIILDHKGKEKETDSNIYDISGSTGELWVSSDYIDLEGFINSMSLSANGLYGLTLNQNAEEVLNTLSKLKNSIYLSSEPKDWESHFVAENMGWYGNQPFKVSVQFEDKIAEGIYEKKTIHSWLYTYTQRTKTGVRFTNAKPELLSLEIEIGGPIMGKGKALYDQLAAKVKALGSVVKQGKNALVVEVGDAYMFEAFTGDYVILHYGYLDTNRIDVNVYDNASEDGDNPYIIELPIIKKRGKSSLQESQIPDDDYGELESPPADDL